MLVHVRFCVQREWAYGTVNFVRHTDSARESTSNGICAIEQADAGREVESRVERREIEEHTWVEAGFEQPNQEPDS